MTNEEAIAELEMERGLYVCSDLYPMNGLEYPENNATPDERAIKALEIAIELLKNQPKQGKWIPAEYPFMPECEECSVCGFRTAYGLNLNFCPNCGAKMRGDDDV